MIAGFIGGDYEQLLDHIAPLCALKKFPLILTSPNMLRSARDFYPDLVSQLCPIDQITKRFTTLITPHHKQWRQTLLPQEPNTAIWCPHGHSYKTYDSEFRKLLAEETHLYVYGKSMQRHFTSISTEVVGDYRFLYNLRRKSNLEKTSVLFAPTWATEEELPELIDTTAMLLMAYPMLKIKLHPRVHHLYPDAISTFSAHLIAPNEPIHPILDTTSVLITDHSSIGYDFLAYDRPLLFVNIAENDPLHAAGTVIDAIEDCPEIIEEAIATNHHHLSTKRSWLYRETFA
ncbi:MAG: CDP-glycerol glycerophosphotransferase family protein [Simkaniaceae bacterium]|nr:CDP-glycerol glycerophosphotransferase family protein [Simkaniaceae bacterium]